MSLNPKKWLLNLLISIDQLGNTILGGSPDETISARAGRYRGKVWYWTGLAKVLNWIEPRHVEKAIQSEVERTQYPPAYRPDGTEYPGSTPVERGKQEN